MKYKALLLDFYGTLVAEDDHVIKGILQNIASCSPVSADVKQIGRDWRFQELCNKSFGENFKTQRTLEIDSLSLLLSDYKAALDPLKISSELFTYWRAPEVFEDAKFFVQNNTLPVCIVSNIDTDDLLAASAHAGWNWKNIVTSEICCSYKPRAEMFLSALKTMGCGAEEVLHIGDSPSSDVAGAQQLGIDTAWINRKGRDFPGHISRPTFMMKDMRELIDILKTTNVK